MTRRPTSRPTKAAALAMLRDLYEQLPPLLCRGLCHDSCTIIDASELEREQLAERGVVLPDTPAPILVKRARRTGDGKLPRCPGLTAFNTCRAYDARPFICRAFGTYVPLCQHGCLPEDGRVIPMEEMTRILMEIERLSRLVTGVTRMPLPEDVGLTPSR